ncbi:MAG TPA: hypothetical protein PK876_04490 [Elusimicrobiota bacterium]|nr:hypothetical protein [Elusimicrobiota bacterium]
MKKIKKFRVQPRPSYTFRGLKALVADAQDTPELEKAIETEIRNAEELYSTAALYETCPRDKSPEWARSLLEATNENGAQPVSLTFYAATIGNGLEEELGNCLSRGEGLRSQILTAVGYEAADQSAHFVGRLVTEEAKREGCDTSNQMFSVPDPMARDILNFLDGSKIQIQLDGQDHLLPRFSRIGCLFWWPPTKRRASK